MRGDDAISNAHGGTGDQALEIGTPKGGARRARRLYHTHAQPSLLAATKRPGTWSPQPAAISTAGRGSCTVKNSDNRGSWYGGGMILAGLGRYERRRSPPHRAIGNLAGACDGGPSGQLW